MVEINLTDTSIQNNIFDWSCIIYLYLNEMKYEIIEIIHNKKMHEKLERLERSYMKFWQI